MNLELVASSVFPLLVALFNLVVAGYGLAGARADRSILTFALGPIGVGLFAIAWFVANFHPESLDAMRVLGSVGGLSAMIGFALDAVRELGPVRGRRVLVSVGALAFAGLAALTLAFGARALELPALVPRVVATALVGVTFVARSMTLSTASGTRRRWLARHVLVMLVAGAGYTAYLVAAIVGARSGVDPLLFVVLVAECLALLYVLEGRVEVRILVSRAITYTVLSGAVAGVAAIVFRLLGWGVDLPQLGVTVGIALFAAVLFLTVGQLLQTGLERLLFPERLELTRALSASRAELALLRRRLERVEKLAIAGELASSVAHEIKNPLAPIRGYAQLLEQRLEGVPGPDRPLFEKGLKIIREESDRIDRRIGELLSLGRGSRESASAEERCLLPRVIDEVVAVLDADRGEVELRRHPAPGIGWVAGDEDELRGALLNLLKNALEATHEAGGRRIDVLVAPDGDRVRLELIDEGPGFADVDKLFQAFYTTKSNGTGLGLAIARSAIEAAGGKIAASNRSDRTGAKLTIWLTAARPPAALGPGPVQAEAPP